MYHDPALRQALNNPNFAFSAIWAFGLVTSASSESAPFSTTTCVLTTEHSHAHITASIAVLGQGICSFYLSKSYFRDPQIVP